MPDYQAYQKSISDELISIKDRVRYFIDNHHWAEDGRYKEIILSHVLEKHLPKGVSIGTGFVVNNQKITRQIDIIIYRNNFPIMFQQDNFVIVPAESVLGIIEVKTNIHQNIVEETIKNATDNGKIIDGKIFNGIFSFEESNSWNSDKLKNSLISSNGTVNHICFGPNIFIKYWKKEKYNQEYDLYSIYEIEKYSFGYFISNLIEHIHNQLWQYTLSKTMYRLFYPIEKTKEAFKKEEIPITNS